MLAVLALRGPQTVNELRTRTERYPGLDDMGGVDGILHRLKNRYEEPYVTRLGREPGQREERWAHLLAGEVLDVPAAAARPARLGGSGGGSGERMAVLEEQVAAMQTEIGQLRAEVAAFRALLE